MWLRENHCVVFLLRQLLGRWPLADQQSNFRPSKSGKRPKSSLHTETLNLDGIIGLAAFVVVAFCKILARRRSKFLEWKGCLSAYLVIGIEFSILEFPYLSDVLYKVGLRKGERYFHTVIWSSSCWTRGFENHWQLKWEVFEAAYEKCDS